MEMKNAIMLLALALATAALPIATQTPAYRAPRTPASASG